MKNISYNLIDLRPSFSCSQHRSDFKVSASLSGGPIVYRRLPPHFRCLARRMAENYARQSVVWLPKMGGGVLREDISNYEGGRGEDRTANKVKQGEARGRGLGWDCEGEYWVTNC